MKILFTGGGTAGHVTPNIALINITDAQCYYMGTDGMEKTITAPYVESGKIKEYAEISAGKFQRKFTFENFLLPFRLIKSVNEAKRHLERIRPDVVFSKGGFVGLPPVIAAKKLKIPSVVHESDLSMGLANKISALYATELISAFPCHKKANVTGAIVRKETVYGDRAEGLKTMGFDGKKPVLLVMGGSLGAAALNKTVSECEKLTERFDIFVICGKNKSFDCKFVNQKQYVDNIGDVYAASSVAVTRGGSNSLLELTLANVPFVTVPLEKCSRGEQLKNALWFCDRKCGITLREENCTPDRLNNAVNTVYDNRAFYMREQRKLKSLDGTESALKVIESLAKSSSESK